MSGNTLEYLKDTILPGDRIIKASAGTGKTTHLTQLTIDTAKRHLKEEGRLPRLIVTTFTRKATEELKERISRKILLEQPDLIGLAQSSFYLHISTIHGVLSTFLKRYGHLCGLESGFQIVDKDAADQFLITLLHDFFSQQNHREEFSDLLAEFSFEQLIQAIDALYEISVVSPDSGYATTAIQKASMQRNLLAEIKCVREVLADVNSFLDCNESWREYGRVLDQFTRKLEEKTDTDFKAAIEELLLVQDKRPRYGKSLPFDADANKAQRESVTDLKKKLEKLAEWQDLLPIYEKWNQSFDLLRKKLVPLLIEEKKVRGILDSRDLELFALLALRAEPELARAFASDFDFWMIDEFQDTSPLQIQLVNLLRGDAPAQYVGDPQQSIYLFRGARVEVFDKVHAAIEEKNGKQERLLKNYRSSPQLLSCINDLLENMGPAFSRMKSHGKVTRPDECVAKFCLEPNDTDDDLRYSSLLSHIHELRSQGAQFGEICVLGRTQLDLSRVAQALQKNGIPSTLHIATGFFSRREILDVLSLIKFLVNPYDDANLLALLRSAFFHMTDQELLQLSERKETVWLQLHSVFAEHPIVIFLKKLQQTCRARGVFHTVRDALEDSRFFASSLYLDPSHRREANIWKLLQIIRDSERTAGFNYTNFLRKIELAWVDASADDADAVPITEANRVNLMTVHKSKGLNFKHVIIPHMEKVPRFSHSRAHESMIAFDEDKKIWSALCIRESDQKKIHSPAMSETLKLQDERELREGDRLLYVAITRAERSLFFHAVDKGKDFSDKCWAHHFPNWHGTGAVQKAEYSMVSSHGPWQVPPLQSTEGDTVELRKPYSLIATENQLDRFSVSSMLEAEAPASVSVKSVKQKKAALYAPGKGMLLHKAFEALKYQNTDSVLKTQQQFCDEEEEFASALGWALKLDNPPVQQLIKTGQVEWGFQVLTPQGVMEGQIDLWGKVGPDVWLVDYKSGSTKHGKKALKQLELYAYALAKMYGVAAFRTAVIFPFQNEVIVEEIEINVKDFEGRHFSVKETQIELFPNG